MAEEICRIVSYTAASEAAEFADGRVVFLGYLIGAAAPWRESCCGELAGIRGIYRMVVTAIARNHETIIPRGEDVITEGDIVYFVCNKSDLPAINYLFDFEKQPTKTVLSWEATKLAKPWPQLLGLNLRIKLIEPDLQLCERLAEELDEVAVLNTNPTTSIR